MQKMCSRIRSECRAASRHDTNLPSRLHYIFYGKRVILILIGAFQNLKKDDIARDCSTRVRPFRKASAIDDRAGRGQAVWAEKDEQSVTHPLTHYWAAAMVSGHDWAYTITVYTVADRQWRVRWSSLPSPVSQLLLSGSPCLPRWDSIALGLGTPPYVRHLCASP